MGLVSLTEIYTFDLFLHKGRRGGIISQLKIFYIFQIKVFYYENSEVSVKKLRLQKFKFVVFFYLEIGM